VPEQVLDQLRHVTGGVPLYIVEVVHALRAGGVFRPRPATGDFYIASEDLLQSVGDAAPGAAGGARLGRAAAARGRADEARALLGWLREQCPEDIERPLVRAILRIVELLIQSPAADDPAERDTLLAETRESALLDELGEGRGRGALGRGPPPDRRGRRRRRGRPPLAGPAHRAARQAPARPGGRRRPTSDRARAPAESC